MNYQTTPDYVLVTKKEEVAGSLTIDRENSPEATMFGIVAIETDSGHYSVDDEIIFVRGQSRKIQLDGKDYYLLKEENVLLYRVEEE